MNNQQIKDVNYYYQKINFHIGKTIHKFNLIENGDKILVAVSGGKDSLTLLYFLMEYQKKAPIHFDLLAFHLQQGQPGEDPTKLIEILKQWKVPYYIEFQNTYNIVKQKTQHNKIYCSLCSRLRRGIITKFAEKFQCNVIALGHHREDVIETLFLNMFFSGKLFTIRPIYYNQSQLKVIRPLYTVRESWISKFVELQNWEVLPCNLCNNITNSQRKKIKNLLSQLETEYPNIKNSVLLSIEQWLEATRSATSSLNSLLEK